MFATYKFHVDATLSYMEDDMQHFDSFKDVFSHFRAGKKAKAKANALTTEHMKKQKEDD